MTDKDTFKKFLNKIKNAKTYNNMSKISSTCSKFGCSSNCNSAGSSVGSCTCDEDSACEKCTCEKSKAKKPNSETLRDDGCFCRKCNEFMPMVEPDEKNDGKALCYGCAHPW